MGHFYRFITAIPIFVLLSCWTINGFELGHANDTVDAAESGICSFYGPGVPDGWPTASGEPFHAYLMKAAHKTLPFGSKIRVRNSANGKTVDVTINDRGPFTPGRIVDLTSGAFGKIANLDTGIVKCSYDKI